MRILLLGLSGLCFLYYILIVSYAGITADFAWIWPAAGLFLILLYFLARYDASRPGRIPAAVRWILKGGLAAGILVFAVLLIFIMTGMGKKGKKDLDYVVVLGAQVKGERPSRALRKRLDRALAYAEENPDTILILSGGKGTGEDISEALCMKEYLTGHGIPEERLVLEDRSSNTRENLLFSDRLTGCAAAETGILSNDFHVYRAVRLAVGAGYRAPRGIAAEGDPLMEPHYLVREVFAVAKELVTGKISLL